MRAARMTGKAALGMGGLVRLLRFGVCAAVCASVLSCGGGSGHAGVSSGSGGGTTTTGSNVASVIVNSGPLKNSINTLFTSVIVCVPGSTTNCQTIDDVEVDTGSYGLRILASALTLTLPVEKATAGSLVECTVFADGYSWGPIALVDLQIAGEAANNLPMQLIGDSRFPTIPADCSGSGGIEEDTVATFGANGILGIGVLTQDCGSACVTTAEPAAYYSCSSATACVATTVPLADQVQNPIAFFATDKNGSIIDLPSVAEEGAATVTGSLIFGIDTQSNNASGTQTVLTLDPDFGYLTASFTGGTAALSQSFIDSGSNAIYFNDNNIPQCADANDLGFYCPTSSLDLTVTLVGVNSVTSSVPFIIDNAETLGTNDPTFTAFPTLGGTFPGNSLSFDYGLPFYYGRRVATALVGEKTSVGTGPYVAF